MTTPKISFIIPTYNAEKYLCELLESIFHQTFTDFEVLLLNDASNDGSLKIIHSYSKDSRIRIFHWDQNRGAQAGTFFLLSQMRGDFWCYPGADDILDPTFLEERLAFIEHFPECALVHGRPRCINENGEPVKNPTPDLPTPKTMNGEDVLAALIQHNFINAPSVIVRSSLTKIILPWFTGAVFFPMDWYLWILIAALGYDFKWDSRQLHSYRIHSASNSLAPSKLTVRRAENRLVPLLALSKAARYSDQAAVLWSRFREQLYATWLQRAFALRNDKSYNTKWHRLAAHSFNLGSKGGSNLQFEVIRNIFAIARYAINERAARSRQNLIVSGLAQLDHQLFRKAR